MSIQTVNIGSYANAGDGDTLRAAMTKINANFAEIGSFSVATADISYVTVQNSSAGATPYAKFGVAGSTAYGVTLWHNAFVLEGASSGGVVIGSYNAPISLYAGTARAAQVKLTTDGTLNTGIVRPLVDNTSASGAASYRWSVVYAGTGTISTSDAREKTAVSPLTAEEIAAAKDLANEIGTYQFLSSIADKGAENARHHAGMTVQRAIEIMQAHGLDPFRYGFICHDEWADEFIDHAAIEGRSEVLAQPAEYETQAIEESVVVDGQPQTIHRSVLVCVKQPVEHSPAIEARPAWREQVQTAGDRYAFRSDELLFFLARGFEARLAALEGA